MATRALAKPILTPTIFEDFFKPWNEIFETPSFFNRTFTMPAVNISENNDEYKLELAAPGLKKEDFKIDIEGNMMTISTEMEEKKEEKEEKFTKKEYSYTSFTRSFSIPEDVKHENIFAKYVDGILVVQMPRKEEMKKAMLSKHINVN
jgi:HSP20 family protein